MRPHAALALAAVALTACAPTPPDATPPLVAIRSPAAGAQVADTVRVEIDASDASGVRCVTLIVDDAPQGVRWQPPWALDWASGGLADSSLHALTAEALDEAGNRALSPACVVCVRRNQPPAIAILAPEPDRWIDLDAPARAWRAAASDPDEGPLGGERIVWFVDGVACATRGAEITPPPLAEGAHAIRAEARDAWGRSARASRAIVAFRYPDAADPRGALEGFLDALRARDPARAAASLDPGFRSHPPVAAESFRWDGPCEETALRALLEPDTLRLSIDPAIGPVERFEWRGRERAEFELTPFAAEAIVTCAGRESVWRVSSSAARVFLARGGDGLWRLDAWWDLHAATWCSSANPSWSALKTAAREGRLCR
jgi:hypothetical protein